METTSHTNANDRRPSTRRPSGPSMAKTALIVLLIIVSVLLIAAMLLKVFFVHQYSRDIKSKQYQALFLTNGQVYFGKLTKPTGEYVVLKDIYYLQTQPAQPAAGSNSANTQQSLTLAKLGNELHGPEDIMYVSNDQVLFWENLKDSGKVVEAIKSYQSGKK